MISGSVAVGESEREEPLGPAGASVASPVGRGTEPGRLWTVAHVSAQANGRRGGHERRETWAD